MRNGVIRRLEISTTIAAAILRYQGRILIVRNYGWGVWSLPHIDLEPQKAGEEALRKHFDQNFGNLRLGERLSFTGSYIAQDIAQREFWVKVYQARVLTASIFTNLEVISEFVWIENARFSGLYLGGIMDSLFDTCLTPPTLCA
jgi:hypothetical protein